MDSMAVVRQLPDRQFIFVATKAMLFMGQDTRLLSLRDDRNNRPLKFN
jgi:hypothetical protein